MINKDKLFQLFTSPDNNGGEYTEEGMHPDFVDDSYYKIGMFTKLIQNNKVFHQKLKQFFKSINKEFDEETTKSASELSAFNRAWYYVKDVQPDDPEHVESINKMKSSTFIESLKAAILYFEKKEEYEKCAHLFKIQKIVKES